MGGMQAGNAGPTGVLLLDMNALEKLRETTDAIVAAAAPMKILDQWTLAGRLLSRFPVDMAEAERVLRERDAAGLDGLVAGIERPATKQDAPTVSVSEDEMSHALKAFRKRLKLARLADESKLGGRYTSGGRKSKIDAIEPPAEYGTEVWKALARAGKLKDTGGGFYSLV